jgi:pimeloyl-ACP methyl ester carboxylesterase
MGSSLPLVLVPGLLCSARLYGPQIDALWPLGPVTVADHRRDNEIGAVAAHILAAAPPRFALVGLSLGGYIAFAMMRQAPERIVKLALLDTSARPDTPEQSAARHALIAMAEDGRLGEVVDTLALLYLHRDRHKDATLRGIVRAMAEDTGAEAFVRQQQAIMSRPDSRPRLGDICCPTLVLTGDGDELTPPDLAREIADGISGSKLVIVPDCGHLSTIERPGPVNLALAEWLEA